MIHETLSKAMWKRFVQEGVIDPNRIDKQISESWLRCKRRSVDPYSGKGYRILEGRTLSLRKKSQQELYDISLPHIEKLYKFLEDSGMIALLIDPEGYVLSMKGERQAIESAREINFIEGVRWTEEDVGTNAIGTALVSQEPIMVLGTEHYSVASHNWSCAASPIRDDSGQLLGILDISCPLERSHPNTLAIVTTVTYAIESEWTKQRQQKELELMRYSLQLSETEQAVVIVNLKQQIVHASKTVRQAIPQWSSMLRHNLCEYGYAESLQTPIYSKKDEELIGYCVHLKKSGGTVSGVSFSARPFYFRGEAGVSASFQRTMKEIERVSTRNANVFIRGESGTGKELIARAIHDNGPNHQGPFIAVNCGAIPKDLIESELFGYAEGAFTGSRRHGYKGKLEQADGGTLFLDEIGEIPHSMQVSLLRVLQERKVTPIGSSSEIPINIRVISATHRDIKHLVSEGTFREDLFYRLHVFPVHVPPLRDRKEDIPYLIRYYCQKNDLDLAVTPEIMQQLMKYDWPGNIRELFNTIERIHILSPDEVESFVQEMFCPAPVQMKALPEPISMQNTDYSGFTYRERVEMQSIIQALEKANGSALMAAAMLKIPRSTFYRKLRKFGL